MDPNRQAWNQQQHLLQTALAHPEKHPEWLSLFLSQHAQVHSNRVADGKLWSFQDEVLNNLGEDALRRIPLKGEHSLAWILWHLARIEDVTMSMLVAGKCQLFESESWRGKLHTPISDTGNAIDVPLVQLFSQAVDLDQLIAYREAVGRRTQKIVSQLPPDVLGEKVEPERIQAVRASGAVTDAADGIIDYWSHRTIAGLLLMPPTRHCFLHWNEASRIKQALRR